MRTNFLIFIFIFTTIPVYAFAVGGNVPTSKSYVDAEIATKQNKIAANDGTAQVLTNTGTAGEIGTKDIYTSANAYSGQTDALIDAVTMNTAVQNAIDSEFQCVDNDCTLFNIFGQTAQQSKNLLDPSFMDWGAYGANTVYGYTLNNSRILPTENGKTYTLSAKLTSTGSYYYYIREVFPDGQSDAPTGGAYMWNCRGEVTNCSRTTNAQFTFTTRDNAVYLVYMAGGASAEAYKRQLTISEYQMEEGSAATAYEPYGNIYLPIGN